MKQQNVQQQNASAETTIWRQALYWRSNAWPKALLQAAEAKGVDCTRSMIVDIDIDFPGMPRLFGLLLTSTGRFIEFEIDTDAHHELIESIDMWRDATAKQNLSRHNPGFGKGRGALALEVLSALNR